MEMMYAETHRLNSFGSWPCVGAVTVSLKRDLACDGFYSTGEPGIARCYFCRLQVDVGSETFDIIDTHTSLSPDCPYLSDPESTDNVRIFMSGELDDERLRLSTFVHWPVSFISREALAKSGFYYIHKSDEVQCAFCSGVIGRWEVGDDPFVEHAKFFPTCPKVIDNATSSNPIPDQTIGIQPVQVPHMAAYSTLDARIRSFATWPMAHVQDPVLLAQAGFYYVGVADEVRCFHCDGGLRFWLVDDDPWFEHARCFPKCQFVQLVKGQLFIENIQTQIRESPATSQQQHHLEQSQSSSGAVAPTMTLEEALSTEPVRMAMQMGLNAGRIRAATLRRLNRLGSPFASSHELVEAVLDDQIDEQDMQPTTSSGRAGRSIEQEMAQWVSTFITNSLIVNQDTIQGQGPVEQTVSVPDGPPSGCAKLSEKSDTKEDCPSAICTEPESQGAPATKILTDEAALRLEEENKRLKDARECKICMSDEVGVVFCPCGHLVSCVQCAPAVVKCPLCRALIKGRVRTFLS